MPDLLPWQWFFGVAAALLVGIAKTGAPGAGTLITPLMVLAVGDARLAAAWTVPLLSTGDVFAVLYWRRHADARKLFSLIPSVAVGMGLGALALGLDEQLLRRIIGASIVTMLVIHIWRRRRSNPQIGGGGAHVYGAAAGFSTTIANAAGPVMNMYFLSRRLPKEEFVATGAWFFFVVNLAKVPIYSSYGLFSRASLTFDALMVPAVLLGGIMGLWLIKRLPQHIFESLVIVLTAISCIFLFR